LFEQKTDDERRTMMKKLMVLALVMSVASLASAALVLSAPAEVNVGESFQLTLSGVWPNDKGDFGLYGPGVDAITGMSKSVLAGNLGSLLYSSEYGGYEMSVGDIDDGNPGNQPGSGVWFTFDVLASKVGTLTFDLYDYAISYTIPTQTLAVVVKEIIPEPATMLLLGLGGLLLRRK